MICTDSTTESVSCVLIQGRLRYFGVHYATSDNSPTHCKTVTFYYSDNNHNEYLKTETNPEICWPEGVIKFNRPVSCIIEKNSISTHQIFGHITTSYTFKIRDVPPRTPSTKQKGPIGAIRWGLGFLSYSISNIVKLNLQFSIGKSHVASSLLSIVL